jgi:PAS domain S-box-containing protein
MRHTDAPERASHHMHAAWRDILGGSNTNMLQREQAYIVVVYSLLCFLSLLVFGTLHLVIEQNPIVGHAELVGAAASMCIALVARYSRHTAFARDSLLVIIIGMLLVMLATGGTAGTGVYWFFIFPVTAFLLTDKNTGTMWMIALIGLIVAYALCATADLLPLAYTLMEVRQLLVVLLVVAFGIYTYQRSREALQNQSNQSKLDLQEEKIRAETILQNIDEGIVATDAHGIIVTVNPGAAATLGWTEAEMVGKKFTTLVPLLGKHGEPVPEHDRPLTHTLQSAAHTLNTLSYRRKDGSSFPTSVESRPITVKGTTVGAIITFRDITKEQAVDRAKTEFVTLASHQLRTPLSAIAWYGEMLLNNDVGDLTPDQREYVEQIYKSNKRSAEMVDAMLTASSLELGDFAIKPQPLDLAKVMHRVVTSLKTKLAPGKQLTIVEDYKHTPHAIILDPDLTRRIIDNLLSNAFKYTPTGGTITLKIYTDTAQDRDGVVIEVTDTGYGIPKRQQSKIFTKLFRAENVKKRDTDGTGLGLYIVNMAAILLGGSVTFHSEENKGSTFTVYLPAMKEREATHV